MWNLNMYIYIHTYTHTHTHTHTHTQMNLPILNFKRLIMTEWELVSYSLLLIFMESVSAG